MRPIDLFLSRKIPLRFATVLAAKKEREAHAVKAAWHWSDLEGKPRGASLVFWGPTGRGKTFAAAMLVAYPAPSQADPPDGGTKTFSALERLPAALFIRAGKLQTMLMGDSLGRTDPLLKWIRATPLLAIDDLGREALDQHGYVYSQLYELLDGRFDAEQRTVITTNLSPERLEDRYGEAMLDRWQSYGVFVDMADGEYERGGE